VASERSSPSCLGTAVGVFVVVAALVGIGWLVYASILRPWRMTDAFFALAEAGDAEAMRARVAPDRRAAIGDADIRRWIAGIRGHSGWSFARKSSSLGTTRGGRAVASQRGYLHYTGSPDECYFSISFIKFDGVWYVDNLMLGRREVPR